MLDSEQPDDSEQFRSEQKNSLPPGSTVLCITFISFDFLHHKNITKSHTISKLLSVCSWNTYDNPASWKSVSPV